MEKPKNLVLEGIERDCIGEFKELWQIASRPEKRLIIEIALADDPGGPDRVPYKEIVALYHEILPMLRPVKVMYEARRSHIRARNRDMPSLTEWESYFRLVARCSHLIGKGPEWNGRIWRADFDWLMNPNNFVKVIEGKYGE